MHAVAGRRRQRVLRGGLRRRRATRRTDAADGGPARRPPGAPAEVEAVAGADLEGLSPDELAEVAERATIFGRVTPEQKQDLVEGLRSRGRYVAMIGDGVNDVIALKQANVAVGMQGGSQAARGVADLILLNDTFAPLPFAFNEGQRIINGMNDILRIFMVRIAYKASIIAVVMALGGFPFAPRQASLVSFVGAGVPAVAFAAFAIPGPTPKLGLFKLLARFFVPTTLLMTAMATGVYLAYALPARHAYLAAHPGADTDRSSSTPTRTRRPRSRCSRASPPSCCCCSPCPPHAGWPAAPWCAATGACRPSSWPCWGWMVAVLVVPLGRTLFELSRLPLWQYLAIFGLAVVWSQLCAWCGAAGLLDRWLGTVEDPGNLCARGVTPKPV